MMMLKNKQGFALITAIMMLFAATVMGLMVMNSSEIEILLSGAQQRYERSFTVAEGASNLEAVVLDNKLTINGRSYTKISNTEEPSIVSPTVVTDSDEYDPHRDIGVITEPIPAEDTTLNTWFNAKPEKWPADRIVAADQSLAYRYLVGYEKWDTVRKGYDSSNKGELGEFFFVIEVANWNVATQTTNARIETGNTYMGPKPTLVMEN